MFWSDIENTILLCTGMDLCHLSIAGKEGALVWSCVSHVHLAPEIIAEPVATNTSKRGPSNEEESPTAACSKFARCSIDKRNLP